MKEDKKEVAEFATFMRAFQINCSVKEITKDQLNLYFSALKQFSMSEVKTAFQRVMYDWIYTKMPPVGVFIKAIEKNQPQLEDVAEIQGTEVLSQIRQCGYYNTPEFKDPVTAHLMSHRFNFKNLCRTLWADQEKWFVKEFIQAYQAIDRNKENLSIEAPAELKQITDNLFESIK